MVPMNRGSIHTDSTSLQTAEANPIILRRNSSFRVIFLPLIVENEHDPRASIKGQFVVQRKTRGGNWEDVEMPPMSSLKVGDTMSLSLKSAEVLKLFDSLADLYALGQKHGVPMGSRDFIEAPRDEALREFVDRHSAVRLFDAPDVAADLLDGLVEWLQSEASELDEESSSILQQSQLKQLGSLVELHRIRAVLNELQQHLDSDDEDYWQDFLSRNAWVVAQVFSVPVMLVRSQVYVGGKDLTGGGGNTADFLYRNRITGNPIVVEIKTPATPLTASTFRNNVLNVSGQFAASVIQTLNERKSLVEEFRTLTRPADQLNNWSARCLLFIGKSSGLDEDQMNTFELFRNSQRDVDIVTFDELEEKISQLISLFGGTGPSPVRQL